MPRRAFSPEQKNAVLERLGRGEKPAAVALATGVSYNTVVRWSTAKPDSGKKRKRRSAAPEPEPDWKFSYELKELAEEYLRRALRVNNETERYKLEIEYLRRRAVMFGDDTLTPLFDEPEQEQAEA